MIQRIQSIYLLLGALALASLFLISALWSSAASDTLAWFSPALIIIAAIIVVGSIVAIFWYKDRKQQRKLVLLAQTLTLVFIAVLYGGLFLTNELIFLGAEATATGIVMVVLLPVLAYLFFFLARRAIEGDIELVRSMDRLR